MSWNSLILGLEPRPRRPEVVDPPESAPPAAWPGESLDGTDELIHRRLVDRRCFARLAARGLGSLLLWHLPAQGSEQLGVDVRRLARVRTDEEDQGVVLRSPGGEEAVDAVEMAAAHVIEKGAGQSVSGSIATAGHELFDGRPCGRGPSTSKRLQLLASDCRQRDLDGRLRLPGISSSRSSSRTGVSLPAAASSSAWSSKGSSSTARSLSRRMTAINSGRSSW